MTSETSNETAGVVVLQRLVSPSPPQDEPHDWYFSDEPKPCDCGSLELTVIEVVPAMMRYPRRVSVRCPKCGAIGQDTCHGAAHAIRRWNWHGDQRANGELSDCAGEKL